MAVVDMKSLKVGEGAQSPKCTAVMDGESLKVGEGIRHLHAWPIRIGSH